jgi:hypothetical protein
MADEIARKANARKGGIARAAALSPEQRSAIARHANQARWHTEQRSRPVAFRIPCDLYDRLMHHAERDGMSASEALRSAVDLYVDTWDNNAPLSADKRLLSVVSRWSSLVGGGALHLDLILKSLTHLGVEAPALRLLAVNGIQLVAQGADT